MKQFSINYQTTVCRISLHNMNLKDKLYYKIPMHNKLIF